MKKLSKLSLGSRKSTTTNSSSTTAKNRYSEDVRVAMETLVPILNGKTSAGEWNAKAVKARGSMLNNCVLIPLHKKEEDNPKTIKEFLAEHPKSKAGIAAATEEYFSHKEEYLSEVNDSPTARFEYSIGESLSINLTTTLDWFTLGEECYELGVSWSKHPMFTEYEVALNSVGLYLKRAKLARIKPTSKF